MQPDIHMRYEGVDQTRDVLRAATRELEGVLENLTNLLNSLKDGLVGNSPDAFRQAHSVWHSATGEMNAQLNNSNVNLGIIRDNTSHTDNRLALTWSDMGSL